MQRLQEIQFKVPYSRPVKLQHCRVAQYVASHAGMLLLDFACKLTP